jgi:hypothetical protein
MDEKQPTQDAKKQQKTTDMGAAVIGLALMMIGLLISLTGIGLCCGLPVILVGLAVAVSSTQT